MRRSLPWTAALLVMTSLSVHAADPAAAGRIKLTTGTVFVVRADRVVPAQAGQPVFETDSLRTCADGRIGVTLNDDTRISLGPNSEMRLDRFAYAPAEGNLGLAIKLVRGVAAYVSGRIAKLSPDSIRLETPAAIVGVRGTSLAFSADSQ